MWLSTFKIKNYNSVEKEIRKTINITEQKCLYLRAWIMNNACKIFFKHPLKYNDPNDSRYILRRNVFCNLKYLVKNSSRSKVKDTKNKILNAF